MKTLLSLAGLTLAVLLLGCATVGRGGASLDADTLNRAELARCAHADGLGTFDTTAVSALAGAYRLYMFDEAGAASVTGTLELTAEVAAETIEAEILLDVAPRGGREASA